MNWRITPSLIEESSSAIKMIEVILIRLAPPEAHICNLKIGPEMACRVSIRFVVMLWSSCCICHPSHRIILVEVFRVLRNEPRRFGPQCRYRLRRIVKVDCEAISLIVIRHIPENIVVDITEEMDLRLNTPIELGICKSRMFVE